MIVAIRGAPRVQRAQGGTARGSDGDSCVLRDRFMGDVIGEADDAHSAITIVVAHLPADVGPAVAGTANQA